MKHFNPADLPPDSRHESRNPPTGDQPFLLFEEEFA